MKKIIFVLPVLFIVFLVSGCAGPRTGARVTYTTTVRAPGPPPFNGAIWIGPEYRRRGGRYVEVPGYWGRPAHSRAVWVPGHWTYRRHSRIWVSGYWR